MNELEILRRRVGRCVAHPGCLLKVRPGQLNRILKDYDGQLARLRARDEVAKAVARLIHTLPTGALADAPEMAYALDDLAREYKEVS